MGKKNMLFKTITSITAVVSLAVLQAAALATDDGGLQLKVALPIENFPADYAQQADFGEMDKWGWGFPGGWWGRNWGWGWGYPWHYRHMWY
ncbi:hypothetical protein BGW38_001558 [Lunasporangiospora selenospora]|uniref:Uncharacterized protein n=1 Tax=Lunasporangiospora selenospora TaxID=979761 RepID=A0A9P6KJ34_9FUNG|nr:hypothetical protein BGW38_001558 [Lunasporangiospora selenospora]